jgi:hypothetical protein
LRKDIVRVILSRQQREILRQIAGRLGQSESETMRVAFYGVRERLEFGDRKNSWENVNYLRALNRSIIGPCSFMIGGSPCYYVKF